MRNRKYISLVLTGVMMISAVMPGTAFAQQSPEFAYSAEKWETLRDDVLEFDEIADLVHEYNNTVLQNYYTYKSDYLDKNAEDIAQDYYDAADDIYDILEYPDSDSDNFGSSLNSYLNNRFQAEQLVERGDKNTDDAKTVKLGYDQTEANLVRQAQELMITYYSQLYNLDSLEQSITRAENSLSSEQTKLAAGTTTSSEVVSAQQSVSSAEASLISGQSNVESTRENLLLMLGWPYGANVVIGELPEPDLEQIALIDVDADTEAALENNYSLQITEKQLTNAHSATVVDELTQTRNTARQAISNNVASSYQSLKLAVSDYEQALQAFSIEESSYMSAQRKLAAGTITRNSFANTETGYLQAEVNVRTTKLALLTACVDYYWNVHGLAATS